MMAVSTSDAFFDLLEKSELLDEAQLAKARKLAGDAEQPKDAARRLIKEGVLTTWQASMLINGRQNLHVGKYKLLEQIGSADSGHVFLAEHVQMGRRVTLRTLSKLQTKDPQAIKQFLADARKIAALDHRNLIHVYDVDSDGDRYFLVSEYVEGRDLQALVEKIGPLEPERAVRYVEQAALGLAHAHEHGITHGDVKPSNLLIDGQDTLHVVDVGVARIANAEQAADKEYQAPERASAEAADAEYGPADDVYALGATLAFLLTGQPRMGKDSGVAPQLHKIYQQMTAKDPQQRCRSMSDVAQALGHWEEEPTTGLEENNVEKNGKNKAATRLSKNGSSKKSAEATRKPPVKATNPRVTIPVAPGGANDPLFGGIDVDPLGAGKSASKPPPITASGDDSKPAIKGKQQPQLEAEQSTPAHTPQKVQRKIPPWMILAGAGGAVVVLLLLVGIVALAMFLRGSGEEVAQGPTSSAGDGEQTAAVDPEKVNGNDPEAPFDPEAAPTPSAGTTDSETPSEDGTSGTPATTDADGSTPPVEPMPPSPETPGTTETPSGTETPGTSETPGTTETPVKPETPKDPMPVKPEPPKENPPKVTPTTPPKPAPPPADPFRKLATSVDLPPLGEKDAPAEGAFEPHALGDLFVKTGELFFMEMHGGENAVFGNRTFTLVPNLTTERDWDVVLARGSQGNLKIGAFAVHDDKLFFQWTPEALEESAAPNFCNCALGMRTGLTTHTLALRKPVEVDPVSFELGKTAKADYTIENAPQPEKILVEIAAVEGIPTPTYDPEQKVPVDGETIYMRFGTPPSAFALKTDSKLRKGLRSTVNLTTVATYKLEVWKEDKIYNDKEVQNLKQQLMAQQVQVDVQIKQMTAQFQAKNTPKPLKDQLSKQILQFQTGLGQIGNQLKEVDAILEQHAAFGAGGKIHYRIYYLAGEQQVDLVRSNSIPAPPKEQPPKAAPAQRAPAAAAKK